MTTTIQLPQGITLDPASLQFYATVRRFVSSTGNWHDAIVGPFDTARKAIESMNRTNSYYQLKASQYQPAASQTYKVQEHVRRYPPQSWAVESEGHILPAIAAENERIIRRWTR